VVICIKTEQFFRKAVFMDECFFHVFSFFGLLTIVILLLALLKSSLETDKVIDGMLKKEVERGV
jgi:hypothetical protein